MQELENLRLVGAADQLEQLVVLLDRLADLLEPLRVAETQVLRVLADRLEAALHPCDLHLAVVAVVEKRRDDIYEVPVLLVVLVVGRLRRVLPVHRERQQTVVEVRAVLVSGTPVVIRVLVRLRTSLLVVVRASLVEPASLRVLGALAFVDDRVDVGLLVRFRWLHRESMQRGGGG